MKNVLIVHRDCDCVCGGGGPLFLLLLNNFCLRLEDTRLVELLLGVACQGLSTLCEGAGMVPDCFCLPGLTRTAL